MSLYEKMKIQVEVDKAKEGKESLLPEEKEESKKGPLGDLLPPLRNFKEGRYEDVLMGFEKKKAKKEGVIVDEPSRRTKRKKQRKKLRKQIKLAEKKKAKSKGQYQ